MDYGMMDYGDMNWLAIVRGKNNTTGVGLIEVYRIQ
jgi:hypothetical protein